MELLDSTPDGSTRCEAPLRSVRTARVRADRFTSGSAWLGWLERGRRRLHAYGCEDIAGAMRASTSTDGSLRCAFGPCGRSICHQDGGVNSSTTSHWPSGVSGWSINQNGVARGRARAVPIIRTPCTGHTKTRAVSRIGSIWLLSPLSLTRCGLFVRVVGGVRSGTSVRLGTRPEVWSSVEHDTRVQPHDRVGS